MSSAVLERRKARWTTGVFFFVSGIISATWASRIPEVQLRLGLNDAQWGAVLFALPAGMVVGLPISSWMVAKYGTRLMMVTSMITFAIMLSMLSLSATPWQLAAVLFAFGLTRNMVNISINTNSLEVQKMYEKPIVANFHGLWSLACFLAAGIGTLMIARGVIPFWHFVMIGACVFSIVLFLIYRARGKKIEKTVSARRPFFIVPDRFLFLLGMITFCAMICESTMFDWSVNYFRQVIRADKEKVTMGYTSFILAMAFGRMVGDKIIARFGPIGVLAANGILMATGFTLAILIPQLLPASAGFLLVGLGDSIVIPLVYLLATKTKIMPSAYAIASVTMIGYIGFLSGPPIVGFISKAFGMQWSFALMALLTLTISFLALRVKRFPEVNR